MPLITLTNLRIGYRGPLLLDGVSCLIEPGQRIGLLGRNGSGKTTFMRIISGEVQPDAGDVTFAPGTKFSLLPQDVPADISGPVHDVIASGAHPTHDDPAWQIEQRNDQLVAEMQLPRTAEFTTLSTGMKRRVLLARALVSKPDLLLLDEPTNHLDVDSIIWLEQFLARWPATLIFVTHDRMFLRKLATRILEVDRGRLFDWSCDYDTFLVRKEAALAEEEKQEALFDKKLAEEEVWIRTGIKARRTRNEGRVRALEKLRRTRSDRQERVGKVDLVIQDAERSGALVAAAKDVTFSYGEKPITKIHRENFRAGDFSNTDVSRPENTPDVFSRRPVIEEFSTTIMRGDKIGVIGPNGVGKTTLLRVLLGQLQPQAGRVRLGTNLQIAYFDQLRHQLRDDETVQQNVADGNDTIRWQGGGRHVIGYLEDFLFSPERSRTPVKFLSGGERNRLLLAKLFTKPANVIVLDEPTNDLDAETLELLEDRLVEFAGTVLVVSHDREFLNNVVGSTLVFEDGNVKEYVGGYDDWQHQRALRLAAEAAKSAARSSASTKSANSPAAASPTKKKLSYKEQKELDAIPALIESLEKQIAELHAAMTLPAFYQQPGDKIATEQAKLKAAEDQLTATMLRWEELENAR